MSAIDQPFSWRLLIQPLHLVIVLVAVVADQISKSWIVQNLSLGDRVEVFSFLNWVHTKNRGAAFGMFHDASESFRVFLFGGVTLLCVGGLFYWLGTTPAFQKLQRCGLSLIMGGALGNVYDRIVYGHVTDFVDFHFMGWHFWAFNIADSCITVGVSLMILQMIFDRKPARQN